MSHSALLHGGGVGWGGGGIGFRIIGFHRKNCSDMANILHGFADLTNTADCGFIKYFGSDCGFSLQFS